MLSENDPSSLPLLSDLKKYPFFLFKKDMNKLPTKKKNDMNNGTKLVLEKFVHKLLIIGQTAMIQASL